jgi:hypothetical protein
LLLFRHLYWYSVPGGAAVGAAPGAGAGAGWAQLGTIKAIINTSARITSSIDLFTYLPPVIISEAIPVSIYSLKAITPSFHDFGYSVES